MCIPRDAYVAGKKGCLPGPGPTGVGRRRNPGSLLAGVSRGIRTMRYCPVHHTRRDTTSAPWVLTSVGMYVAKYLPHTFHSGAGRRVRRGGIAEPDKFSLSHPWPLVHTYIYPSIPVCIPHPRMDGRDSLPGTKDIQLDCLQLTGRFHTHHFLHTYLPTLARQEMN